MNERCDRLETQLSRLRPRAVSLDLVERIGSRLADVDVSPWANRCLMFAMSSGAIAACIIIAILIAQPTAPFPVAPPTVAATDAPKLGDYSLALARADVAWVDRVK